MIRQNSRLFEVNFLILHLKKRGRRNPFFPSKVFKANQSLRCNDSSRGYRVGLGSTAMDSSQTQSSYSPVCNTKSHP